MTILNHNLSYTTLNDISRDYDAGQAVIKINFFQVRHNIIARAAALDFLIAVLLNTFQNTAYI